ncbi:hypothetical protein D3C85_1504970 [compost metagenome]
MCIADGAGGSCELLVCGNGRCRRCFHLGSREQAGTDSHGCGNLVADRRLCAVPQPVSGQRAALPGAWRPVPVVGYRKLGRRCSAACRVHLRRADRICGDVCRARGSSLSIMQSDQTGRPAVAVRDLLNAADQALCRIVCIPQGGHRRGDGIGQ